MGSDRVRSLIVMFGVAALLLGSSCGNGRSPASPASAPTSNSATPTIEPVDGGTITLTTSGCTFDPGDGPIAAGPVSFGVVNETEDLGAANIALLDGATFRDFAQHIDKEIRLAEAGKPGLGHPSFAVPLFDVLVDAGSSGTLEGTLDPGVFVMSCARQYEEVGDLRPSGALGPVKVV